MTRRIDRSLASSGLPPLERSAWVEVDIDQLDVNARALADLSGSATVAPVVKADGYGHGLEMAARCAISGGTSWLCVADSSEAARLRRDGFRGRIFVLYPVPAQMSAVMAGLGVDVTVGQLDQIAEVSSGLDGGAQLSVHLEIDTGMTRGGVALADSLAAARALVSARQARLGGVWTHLAAPEDPETTEDQLELFHQVVAQLVADGIEPGEIHAAASGGVLSIDTSQHTLVRPGLAYYGLHPGAGRTLPDRMRPALSVKAHPVRIADAPSGTRVGYAGTWAAPDTARIATLPIGYADGWSRSSSPGSSVLVEGRRAPVVGRISSDSLTVDITGVAAGPDSEFTLLGRDGPDAITADEIAADRGTISWEVLQQLGSRLTRVYTSHGSPVAIRPESVLEMVTAGARSLPGYDHTQPTWITFSDPAQETPWRPEP